MKDVYGREVTEEYPKLAEFYDVFKTRYSARRDADAGEVAGKIALQYMQTWAEGNI